MIISTFQKFIEYDDDLMITTLRPFLNMFRPYLNTAGDCRRIAGILKAYLGRIRGVFKVY